jgi:hypothetical protein
VQNFDELVTPQSAWLILAYADWSNECWELAENWEKIGKDLSRSPPTHPVIPFKLVAPVQGQQDEL